MEISVEWVGYTHQSAKTSSEKCENLVRYYKGDR